MDELTMVLAELKDRNFDEEEMTYVEAMALEHALDVAENYMDEDEITNVIRQYNPTMLKEEFR